MEIHLEILRNQCRLCGKGLTKESRDKNDLTNKVKQICGIDFENDDPCIHPPRVCDTCRRKLQRYYKEKMKCKRVKTNSIPVVSWVSHSETCTLCLTNRASWGSPDFTSFCTKSTDLFQQHGFIGIEPENESVLMCFVKIKPGADKVFAKVKIHRDRTVSVTILGKSVNVTTATNPGTLSGLETLLMRINSTPICSGYAGFEDLMEKTTDVASQVGAISIFALSNC